MGEDPHLKSTKKKKGFHLASKCSFCGREEEGLELCCPSIWGQWTDLRSAFGVYWACPLLVKDLIQSWQHFPFRKKVKAIWRAAPLTLLWAFWKEWNKIIFEDASFSTLRLKLVVILSFFTWVGCIPNADISLIRIILYRFYGYA